MSHAPLRHGVAAAALMVLLASAAASADGLISIHHTDGTISRYPGSSVVYAEKTLRLRSPDRSGVLVIGQAACSHQGEILVCLPTSATVRQHGTSRPMLLAAGTVYYNPTGEPQALPYSSRVLPPRGILMSLRTEHGTFINLDGTVDPETSR